MSEAPRREGDVFAFDLDGSPGWRPNVVDARWNRTRKLADVPKTIVFTIFGIGRRRSYLTWVFSC